MTNEAKVSLIEAVAIEGETAKRAGYMLPLHLDLSVVVVVCANLQLAMRHPQHIGPSSAIAREVVDAIIQRLRDDGFIATAELAELGNDPANDD